MLLLLLLFCYCAAHVEDSLYRPLSSLYLLWASFSSEKEGSAIQSMLTRNDDNECGTWRGHGTQNGANGSHAHEKEIIAALRQQNICVYFVECESVKIFEINPDECESSRLTLILIRQYRHWRLFTAIYSITTGSIECNGDFSPFSHFVFNAQTISLV